MKNSIYTLTFILLIGTSCALGQNRTNYISCQQYQAITFNGATIDQINATDGEPQELQQVLGSYTSMEESDTFWERTFIYGENTLLFNYERGNVNGHVTNLSIKNDQWAVTIKDHTIKVGDSLSDLKEALGSDLIVVDSQFSSNKYVFFGCENTGSEGVNIVLDPDTNTIIEISYTVFT